MLVEDLKSSIPQRVYDFISAENFDTFRPSQYKAIEAGIFAGKNILVCTPTGSGKTYVAELGFLDAITQGRKAIYIVPLKALATEKHKEFIKKYPQLKIAKSIGDTDKADSYLASYDLIITTSEKLDSLIRHGAPWLNDVGCVIIDEIHNLNDPHRGPTLEIVITLIRTLIRDVQIVALSATIGNPAELAEWLDAKLVADTWRPVELKKGVYLNGEVQFVSKSE